MNNGKKILIVSFLIISFLFAKDFRTILKNNIHLRQGPGCYYPLIKVLNIGDTVNVLSSERGWAQISHKDTSGWISDQCFTKKTIDIRISDNILLDSETTVISKITAGGAVKGFAAKNYSQNNNPEKNIIFKSYLAPNYYHKIKNSMTKYKLSNRKYRNLTKKKTDFHINKNLENIGNLVATQIASQGLISDPKKLSYLNAIGTLVLEETDLYYHQIKYFIVDDEHKAAYATPNGMIFVTKGLLDIVQNEAELACLLGHEISHIIYQHGYEELQKRKIEIKAEDAFADLDMEMDYEKSEEQLELESLATKFFENATAPRQIGYEYEADKMGVIFATKAGYDPYALTRLLARLKNDSEIDFENFESNWEKRYIKDRIDKVSRFIGHHLDPNNVRNRERFQTIFH